MSPDCPSRSDAPPVIGVLRGEGIGPEVMDCALEVLRAVEDGAQLKFDLRFGGLIGRDAESKDGRALTDEVVAFCRGIFEAEGAVLNGPGGGRYVYDLRKRFDLFLKISPLVTAQGVPGACRLKPESVRGTDILLLRENVSGVYQGTSLEGRGPDGVRYVEHSFRDDEFTVRRFLIAAAHVAQRRRGELTVVVKDSGVPGISALWRECAGDVAAASEVRCTMVDVDLMAYRLIQHAPEFDVIAAPNLCGDVLADLGAVLLGSRGVSYSGNFGANGPAVYQTNHGAAYDLAGKDRANPVGQIHSLAMMLRESLGMGEQAAWIDEAVRSVWAAGWRTDDVAQAGCRSVGTREMGRRIAEEVARVAGAAVEA